MDIVAKPTITMIKQIFVRLSFVMGILIFPLSSLHADSVQLEDCGNPSPFIQSQFPKTDFSSCLVRFDEIRSGGPGRDGIPAIDDVMIKPVSEETSLVSSEPVISLVINGEARAWPLRYLIWHEIANDTLGGMPVSATYCPLCNAAIVFDRRHQDQVLDFGTTGLLRKSDLVMYDRQTETWWQQYTGQAIIGHYTGQELKTLPSRLENWGHLKHGTLTVQS